MLTYKPTLVTIMSTFKVIVDIKLASVLESIEEHYKLSIDILDENHDIIEKDLDYIMLQGNHIILSDSKGHMTYLTYWDKIIISLSYKYHNKEGLLTFGDFSKCGMDDYINNLVNLW